MSLADRMADEAQYGQFIESSCDHCARKNPDRPLTCEAFPHGIPAPIWLGIWDHRLPYDFFGESDHGLTYSPMLKPEASPEPNMPDDNLPPAKGRPAL